MGKDFFDLSADKGIVTGSLEQRMAGGGLS
jgi:hypothetical protein